MKTIIAFMAALTLSLTACADRHHIVGYDMLPVQAQTFVKKYFSNEKIAYIEREREGLHYEYNVYLTNATEIDFDYQGNLESVDCGIRSIPKGIVPEKIMQYVEYHFPDFFVVEYAIDRHRMTIELNNGLELLFDTDGNLLEIDD